MSDKMKTYFKGQERSASVNIKPGLKEVANQIASDLFPCALVSADDAVEYLISMFAQANNVTVASNNKPAPDVHVDVNDPMSSVMEAIYKEHVPEILSSPQPVILTPREENIYDVDASQLNFTL
jgi:hypothetical protein